MQMPSGSPPAGVKLVPPDHIPAPPYANSVYTFIGGTAEDYSMVFLRIPLLNDEQIRAVNESGDKKLVCEVVASVTLPLASARAFVEHLSKALDQLGQRVPVAENPK